jgi:hypothetical protein
MFNESDSGLLGDIISDPAADRIALHRDVDVLRERIAGIKDRQDNMETRFLALATFVGTVLVAVLGAYVLHIRMT